MWLCVVLCGGCLDFDGLPGLYQPAADGGLCPAGAGGITRQGATSTPTMGSLTSLTLDEPSGLQPCDLLVMVVYLDQTTSVTDPSGWTRIDRQMDVPNSWEARFYYHVVVDPLAEPTIATITYSQANLASGVMAAYRGANVQHVLDGMAGGCNDPGPYALPAITTTIANDRVLVMCASDDATGVSVTWTAPAGMSEPSGSARVALFEATQASSGVTPARSVDNTDSGHGICCEQLALSPR